MDKLIKVDLSLQQIVTFYKNNDLNYLRLKYPARDKVSLISGIDWTKENGFLNPVLPEGLQIANLALRTGINHNLIVLDLDIKEGVNGYPLFIEWLETNNIPYPYDAPHVITRSGGVHIYLKPLEDMNLKTTVKLFSINGFDIRAEGGIIFAPPTQLTDKTNYIFAYHERVEAFPTRIPVINDKLAELLPKRNAMHISLPTLNEPVGKKEKKKGRKKGDELSREEYKALVYKTLIATSNYQNAKIPLEQGVRNNTLLKIAQEAIEKLTPPNDDLRKFKKVLVEFGLDENHVSATPDRVTKDELEILATQVSEYKKENASRNALDIQNLLDTEGFKDIKDLIEANKKFPAPHLNPGNPFRAITYVNKGGEKSFRVPPADDNYHHLKLDQTFPDFIKKNFPNMNLDIPISVFLLKNKGAMIPKLLTIVEDAKVFEARSKDLIINTSMRTDLFKWQSNTFDYNHPGFVQAEKPPIGLDENDKLKIKFFQLFFSRHILNLLTGDMINTLYLFKYFKNILNMETDRCVWMPVIVAPSGIGKSMIHQILAQLMPKDYTKLLLFTKLAKDYNDLPLGNKLLVSIDEFPVSKKKSDLRGNGFDEQLRDMITNEDLDINEKYIKEKTQNNSINFLMFSQDKGEIDEELQNRRYWVLKHKYETIEEGVRYFFTKKQQIAYDDILLQRYNTDFYNKNSEESPFSNNFTKDLLFYFKTITDQKYMKRNKDIPPALAGDTIYINDDEDVFANLKTGEANKIDDSRLVTFYKDMIRLTLDIAQTDHLKPYIKHFFLNFENTTFFRGLKDIKGYELNPYDPPKFSDKGKNLVGQNERVEYIVSVRRMAESSILPKLLINADYVIPQLLMDILNIKGIKLNGSNAIKNSSLSKNLGYLTNKSAKVFEFSQKDKIFIESYGIELGYIDIEARLESCGIKDKSADNTNKGTLLQTVKRKKYAIYTKSENYEYEKPDRGTYEELLRELVDFIANDQIQLNI